MIFNSTRTIYNIKLGIVKLLGLEYKPELNTTLNEKFNIYPNIDLDKDKEDTTPKLNIITIGVGGTDLVDNKLLDLKRSKHAPIEGALYKHLPFLMVEENIPLTNDQKKIYRLKTKEEHNGKSYICYYGKVVDNIDYDSRIFELRIDDGLGRLSPIITNETLDILNPTPGMISSFKDIPSRYLLNSCKVVLRFTKEEMERLVTYSDIIYPDEKLYNLTEIGLASSIDKVFQGEDGTNYNESVWTQINYFIDFSLDMQLRYNNQDGVEEEEYIIDIGGMEPLALPN